MKFNAELVLDVVIIILVLIAFNHLAHKYMVCDLAIETSYPLCNSVYVKTFENLDFYALNYFKAGFMDNTTTKVIVDKCHFLFKRNN